MRKAHAFPSGLLQDLAGNAFNALCDAACELALTVVLAVAHTRRVRQAVAKVASPVRKPSEDESLDDDAVLDELWAWKTQQQMGSD